MRSCFLGKEVKEAGLGRDDREVELGCSSNGPQGSSEAEVTLQRRPKLS